MLIETLIFFEKYCNVCFYFCIISIIIFIIQMLEKKNRSPKHCVIHFGFDEYSMFLDVTVQFLTTVADLAPWRCVDSGKNSRTMPSTCSKMS